METSIFDKIDELVTLQGAAGKCGRHVTESDLSIIKKAAMVVINGRIHWIGERRKLPKSLAHIKRAKNISLNCATVSAGLVECHTHTIFGGNRAQEFELRNQGVSYQEIAAQGGGILSTVKMTRRLSPAKLEQETANKITAFARQGVTTLEIKTGYGLNEKDEIKCLQVIKKLSEKAGQIRLVPTFLGAHAIPPEFNSEKHYFQAVLEPLLVKIKKTGLANRVDIFIENGFFSVDLATKYLAKALASGFDVTIHADQLSLNGGTSLAVLLKAKSADHVLQISKAEISQIGQSETTAVLLPTADFYMRCSYPAARSLIDLGGRVALATDYNPGSSPTQDVSLVGLLARLEMKMTLPEVISAYTVGAAFALGLEQEVGSLELGKSADFFTSEQNWRTFFYAAGGRFAKDTYVRGRNIAGLKLKK